VTSRADAGRPRARPDRTAVRGGGLPVIEGRRAALGAPHFASGQDHLLGLKTTAPTPPRRAPPCHQPVLFLEGARTVVVGYDDVLIPRRSVKNRLGRSKIAVVIGTTARYLGSEAEALACAPAMPLDNDSSPRREFSSSVWAVGQGKNCRDVQPIGPGS